MDNYPTSDQPPLQMLSVGQSKKRRNDTSEDDLARLSDLLSHLAVSKRICQEHGRDQFKGRSMITAATGSINLDPVVRPENRASSGCPIDESCKQATLPSHVNQRSSPNLQQSREGQNCRFDQPVPEDTGAKSKAFRRRYSIRQIPRYVPGHRPRLVESNGCGLHPRSMPVSCLCVHSDNAHLLTAASG